MSIDLATYDKTGITKVTPLKQEVFFFDSKNLQKILEEKKANYLFKFQ